MKFLFTLWIGKIVAAMIRVIDKSRGSDYSGRIAVKLMPDFVAHFKGIDYDKVVFITGTNGKSSTTNLVGHMLKSAGKTVASNVEGANMMSGVATTLLKNSSLSGRLNKEFLVLEIDERSFPAIHNMLPGRQMGITNLQKDQAQRNGDPDFIYRKFEKAISKDMTLYLNSEEPRSKALEDCPSRVIYFSVGDNEKTCDRHEDYMVTLPCPKCGHSIRYERWNLASIGPFHCTHCSHSSNSRADVKIDQVNFADRTFLCDGKTWHITYNNPFYIYNYALAIALGRQFKLSDEQIDHGFETFKNPLEKREVLTYHGKNIHYLRMKQENPETMQSALDTIAEDPSEKAVFVGMYKVKDFLPHFTNTFYFFDCNFAPIAKTPVERYVVFSSTVCYDTAQRIAYAGAPEEDITVLDTDDVPTVLAEIDKTKTDNIYFLTNSVPYKQIKRHFVQGEGERK